MKKDFLEKLEKIDTKLEALTEELSELKYEDYYQDTKMTIKDLKELIKNKDLKELIKNYDDDQEIKIFATADNEQYVLEFEGVGGIENESKVYFFAKE